MSDTDVVVFIDALKPSELEGLLEDIYQGDMDADVPRVTPRVMSSIYTGLNPAENGMMEVSKYGGEDTTRPKKSTFIDQAVRHTDAKCCTEDADSQVSEYGEGGIDAEKEAAKDQLQEMGYI